MGSIVEIKCSGLSKDNKGNYSTLHPRYCKFRDDKREANKGECREVNHQVGSPSDSKTVCKAHNGVRVSDCRQKTAYED